MDQAEIRADARARSLHAIVLLLFLFSGISGLIYEVVWVRQLTTILGNTVFAVSTILTVFMGGLALGSFWAGRFIDRGREPLRFYAFLEISIGILGLILTFLLNQTGPAYIWIHDMLSGYGPVLTIARYVMVFFLLVIPTTLMGATLPVLSKFVVDRQSVIGARIGKLYALNTFGAAVGCYLAGFILIGNIGIKRTVFIAAGINVAVGIIAWCCQRWFALAVHAQSVPSIEAPAADQKGSFLRFLVLTAAGVSGLAALGYEVVWTRVLIAYLGNSIYAFATMLTAFLVGIGLGSIVLSSFVDRRKHLVAGFGIIEVGIGLYALLLILMFGWSMEALEAIRQPFPTWQGTILRFLKAFGFMLIPTFLMGAMFPVAGRIYTDNFRRIGHRIGELYAFNTVGAIIGAIVTGFALMPALGLQKSQLVLLILNIIVGIALCASDRTLARKKMIALVTTLVVIILTGLALMPGDVFRQLHELSVKQRDAKLLFYKEDIVGTVTVEEKSGNRRLMIDNLELAGTAGGFLSSSKSLGHVPMLLHPYPKSVFVLGFGGGGTAYAVSTYPEVERIDLAELSQSVINVAPMFDAINHNVISDPRFHYEVTDGRHFLLTTKNRYDVISVDLLYPQTAGAGSLFTREFYELCHRRLNEGGLMVEWVHYGTISEPYLKTILRSAKEAFPYAALWTTRRLQHFILVASKTPLHMDYEELARRMNLPKTRRDLEEDDLADPAVFVNYFIADDAVITEFIKDSDQINTDDLPVVEYKLPFAGFTVGVDNLIAIRPVKQSVLQLLGNVSDEEAEKIQTWEHSFNLVFDSRIAFDGGDTDLAIYRCRQALMVEPDNKDAQFFLNWYSRSLQPRKR